MDATHRRASVSSHLKTGSAGLLWESPLHASLGIMRGSTNAGLAKGVRLPGADRQIPPK